MTLTNRIKTLLLTAVVTCMPAFIASCSDDDDPILPGTGITDAEWSEGANDVDIKGQTVVFEFTSAGPWTASSSESWAKLITTSGQAGKSSLRINAEENTGTQGRSATVTLRVEGYSETTDITLRQGDGFIEKGNGKYREINEWTYAFMKTNYLWNEKIPSLTLDYSIDYDLFLTSMLDGVASFGNVNYDDGVWENGVRKSYFSNIVSNAPLSRAPGDTYNDSGLALMAASMDGPDNALYVGFAVRWVTPGSPADQAGLKRGDYITKVNNIAVTSTNYQNLGSTVLTGNCTIDVNSVEFSDQGIATLTYKTTLQLGRATYDDPSIYVKKTFTTASGKKVAYLNYMGFHMDYDDDLLQAFSEFKSAGVSDLIIDLRYNTGGHVLSSTLLGTLIAGKAHEGEIYVRTTYNADRTAAGEVGEYRIGQGKNPEQTESYSKIPEGLNNALDLKKVYIIATGYTASASELLINGLRGLDIDVNLIGTTTLGKNVGMEGIRKRWSNYTFDFYPITFYCENSKGFKEYGDGFKPDVEFDDSNYYPFDFGTTDDALSRLAIKWINDGTKPSTSRSRVDAMPATVHALPMTPELNRPLTRRPGGTIQFREL